MNTSKSTGAVPPQLHDLIKNHFSEAEQRVDIVYRQHFASGRAILSRHWRHKRDIPADLMALPRSLLTLGKRLTHRSVNKPDDDRSGKQREVYDLVYHDLLDLPGLETKLEQYLRQAIGQYQQEIEQHSELSDAQRLQFKQYVSHQIDRLQLTNEGLREGLLAFTLMISGRILGDKAILSSAASIGGTLATSGYISQQGYLTGLWLGWMGVPGWVTVAGASAGVISALLLSPVIAPGLEWGINRLRARKLLLQSVRNAEQKILKKDGLLYTSRLGVYLQLLPDLAQFIQRLK
jgi:hypothetical protein